MVYYNGLSLSWPVQIRGELAEKELVLLEKEKELLEKDQTLAVLREEVYENRA